MTELPALVKAAAAACAFLTVSYAVSVYAGPGIGTGDLGRGRPEAPAGVYRRDPLPAPRRSTTAVATAVAADTAGGRTAVKAPPATLVSARTGVAEAVAVPPDAGPGPGADAPPATSPPAGAGADDPVPPLPPRAGAGPGSNPSSGSHAKAHHRSRGRGHGASSAGGCHQSPARSPRPTAGARSAKAQRQTDPHHNGRR